MGIVFREKWYQWKCEERRQGTRDDHTVVNKQKHSKVKWMNEWILKIKIEEESKEIDWHCVSESDDKEDRALLEHWNFLQP